jgi:predicted HTH transcriptional regulator
MTNHDTLDRAYDAQKLLTDLNAVKRISPEFNDLSMDVQEIMKESSNPAFLATLLYKLVKEREETNKVLVKMEAKFQKIQELLLANSSNSHTKLEETYLSEPDQHIMQLVDEKIQVTAQDVKQRLAYKNPNAASQRLNKLAREGHLRRMRSGRNVLFVRQHPTPCTK